mmetsp:Transcript_60703/g.196640  ORF Transcript_60703/g.196640 Transcript_60703/m.196640 type:complete len:296 (+) Transcript_60703:284-1171(+)
MKAKSKLAAIQEDSTAVQNITPVKANGRDQKVAVGLTPKLERGQATTSCGTQRSKPEVVPVAFKLTLKSSAVERYMHDDPYCDDMAGMFGELADFCKGKQVTVHRNFSAAVSAGWTAVQKYVDDGETTKHEFQTSFKQGSGGSWDHDGEHGGDFSVRISRTEASDSTPKVKRTKATAASATCRSGGRLAKEHASVNFKLTLRSHAVEDYMDDDPYCDDLDDVFGDLSDFSEGKQVTMHKSFASAVAAGWASVQKYVDGEVTRNEFHASFKQSCGGSWDYDCEHGGDFSVKISSSV